MFEDMLQIADDGSRDRVMVDGKLRVDNEVAARSRLRVDTRRWALSKLAPVKYGEKVTNVLEGGERPVEFAGMTEDQLRAWIVKEAQALGLSAAILVEVTDVGTPTGSWTATDPVNQATISMNCTCAASSTSPSC